MDREKLNEAAKEHYLFDSIAPWMKRDCFKQGADWLMRQPLSERLTDEEKAKIMEIYRHASCPSNRVTFTGQTVLRLFPSIFGDIFK